MAKNDTFWILRKIGALDFDETREKVESNWMLHNFVYLYSGITLACALGGSFRAKNTPFGAFLVP